MNSGKSNSNDLGTSEFCLFSTNTSSKASVANNNNNINAKD